MVLPEQRVGAVGDTHGDDAHGADHYHAHIHIRKDRHNCSSCNNKGSLKKQAQY